MGGSSLQVTSPHPLWPAQRPSPPRCEFAPQQILDQFRRGLRVREHILAIYTVRRRAACQCVTTRRAEKGAKGVIAGGGQEQEQEVGTVTQVPPLQWKNFGAPTCSLTDVGTLHRVLLIRAEAIFWASSWQSGRNR